MNDSHCHAHGTQHRHQDMKRTCRYYGMRKAFTVDTVPVPEPQEGEALVRVIASGICRSDRHVRNGDWGWAGLKVPTPTTLGHEIGGVVVKVGPSVSRIEPGMRITMPFIMACGYCEYCLRGRQNLCNNALFPLFSEGGRGWQEYIRVASSVSE
jgi:propanol-preferring alcohol dehydrogenase